MEGEFTGLFYLGVKMTLEQAQEIRGVDWVATHKKAERYIILDKYPEIKQIHLYILSFLYEFTRWKNIKVEVVDGEPYFWIDYNTQLAHVWCAECNNTDTYGKHIKYLCGDIKDKDPSDTRSYFLKKHTKQTTSGRRTYIGFTNDTRIMYNERPLAVIATNKALDSGISMLRSL